LDTSTLKEVFDSPVNGEDTKMEVDTSSAVKQEGVMKESDESSKIYIAEGNAWKKLMNLLMQLRKVCNQYLSHQIILI
jgi:hypothetical protein